jgi:hypothetical protein
MRMTALVVLGIVGAATTAQAQFNMSAAMPMLQYQSQLSSMQPMYNMMSPIQVNSPLEQYAQMRAYDEGMASSDMATGSMGRMGFTGTSARAPKPMKIEDASEQPAATPAFWPKAGSYNDNVMVTISTPTPGATIYYTLDGTQPHYGSPIYKGPIKVSQSSHLVAFVVPQHGLRSATVDAQYQIATEIR